MLSPNGIVTEPLATTKSVKPVVPGPRSPQVEPAANTCTVSPLRCHSPLSVMLP
jgi:hypothetical protein